MNYVTNMLAKPDSIRVTQFGNRVNDVDKGMELYLKNSYVCLKSVKLNNPEVKCILYMSFQLPSEWENRFIQIGVEIRYIEFGGYKIGEECNWGIVQFRYDVMKHLCDTLDDDDKVIMLDTDVVCVGSLEQAFSELDDRMCLYDVQHNLELIDRKNIIDNYQAIYSNSDSYNLIHYGGEFIGGNGKLLRKLFAKSVEVMEASSKCDSLKNFNDEHITSIALDIMNDEIRVNNANAYLCRYWTCKCFYLASTNYKFNPVVLWHFPADKDRGMLYMYKYLITNDKMQSIKKMAAAFGLPEAKRSHNFMNYMIQIKRKMGIL